ncbi:hypothetical protein D3C80_1271490 [compost metagenome]
MTETTDVLIALGTVESAIAFELAVDKVAAELVGAGIAADAFAIGLAFGEQALVLAAVLEFQVAGAGILVCLETAAVAQFGILERAFTFAPAHVEAAGVAAAIGLQATLAVEQALLELATVDLAIAAVPFAFALPLAVAEITDVPTAVGIVHAPWPLQQAIDHFATVAATIRQASVGRRKRFSVTTGSEQQQQGERSEWAHGGVRKI